MHGPDLATRFQNLTTQHIFARIPQDSDLVRITSSLSEAPGGPRCGTI